MATPVVFPEATLVLGPPKGMTTAEVVPLPVRHLDGQFVSCWRPTADELAEIARTGLIWLGVWGRETQPPVYVTGHKAEVI